MKKLSIIICLMVFATQSIFALSATRSRAESKFLTDKMAYELNLSRNQIEDVYEINYDFFRSLTNARYDCSAQLQLRYNELRWVLNRYQWEYFLMTDYFVYPVYVQKNKFMYKIYSYYNSSKYYYSIPLAYQSYNGAHYNRNYYRSRADQHYGISTNRPIAIRNTRSDNRYSVGSYNNGGKIDMKHRSDDKVVVNNNRGNSTTATRGESYNKKNDRTYQSGNNRAENTRNNTVERSRTTNNSTTVRSSSTTTTQTRRESHSNGNRRK